MLLWHAHLHVRKDTSGSPSLKHIDLLSTTGRRIFHTTPHSQDIGVTGRCKLSQNVSMSPIGLPSNVFWIRASQMAVEGSLLYVLPRISFFSIRTDMYGSICIAADVVTDDPASKKSIQEFMKERTHYALVQLTQHMCIIHQPFGE